MIKDSIPNRAVKAVIYNDQGSLLLVERFDGLWDLPGGLVEPGEQDVRALTREIAEELNVVAVIGGPAGRWQFFRGVDQAIVTVQNYSVIIQSGVIRLSHEHRSYAWVATCDIANRSFKDASFLPALHLDLVT